PAKAYLDFIGNAHSAAAANLGVHFCEISRGKHDLPRHTGHALRNECGAPLVSSQTINDFRNMPGIPRPQVRFPAPVNAAIVVRIRGTMDPRLASSSTRPVKFVVLMSMSVVV